MGLLQVDLKQLGQGGAEDLASTLQPVFRSVSVQGVEDVLFVGAEENRELGQLTFPNGIINRLT
jgi:hypothetical protein